MSPVFIYLRLLGKEALRSQSNHVPLQGSCRSSPRAPVCECGASSESCSVSQAETGALISSSSVKSASCSCLEVFRLSVCRVFQESRRYHQRGEENAAEGCQWVKLPAPYKQLCPAFLRADVTTRPTALSPVAPYCTAWPRATRTAWRWCLWAKFCRSATAPTATCTPATWGPTRDSSRTSTRSPRLRSIPAVLSGTAKTIQPTTPVSTSCSSSSLPLEFSHSHRNSRILEKNLFLHHEPTGRLETAADHSFSRVS